MRRRRSRHRFTVALAVVLAVTLGVVGLGYGYVHFRFNQIASISLPGLQQSKPSKPFNLLVVGSDTRAGLKPGESQQFGTVAQAGGGQRSDVIIIVHVDPPAHKLSLLSIPRDLLVPIAGTGGRNKVNAAFDIGPERLIETIQQNFNIPINHYLLINFDGFRDIVNALGGAKLNFPYPVRDNDNGNNNSGLHITRTGCQLLNGDQALALARSRFYQYFKDGRWHYADSIPDLGRIRRQHIFLQVVLKTAAVSQTIAYYPAGQLPAIWAADPAVDAPVHLVEDATLTGASVVLVLGPGYRVIHTSLPTATSRVSAGKPKTPAAAPSDVQLSDPRPC
jgi:LCP family protein required for cell wall assembly